MKKFASLLIISSFFFINTAHAGRLFPPENVSGNSGCPNGEVLTWTGTGVTCINPLASISIMCPSGSYLQGISAGQPQCTIINVQAQPPIINVQAQPSTATADPSDNPTTVTTTVSDCTADPAVCAAYAANLNRLPDTSGATYYDSVAASMRAQGASESTITTYLTGNIQSSAEYNNVPSATEKAQSNALIAQGTDAIAAAGSSVGSAASSVAALYESVMGRPADAAGINFYTDQIASGAKTVGQVEADLIWAKQHGGK